MALVKCPDCGTKISTSAAACIKCGRPLTQKEREAASSGVSQSAAVLFAIVIIFGFMAYRANHPDAESTASASTPAPKPEKSPAEKAADERLQRAVIAAKSIKASLRDPESFKLESVLAIDKTGALCFTYRARNGFGGYNRENAVLEKGANGLRSTSTDGFVAAWNRACGNKSGDDLTSTVRVFL